MTLLTHAYVWSPDGARADLTEEPCPPRTDLAGPESWRQKVYGAPVTRALGLQLLPTLKSQDIHAEGADLDLLEREVRVLLANTARWPQVALDSLRARLLNILEAVRLARTVPRGGVYVG